LKSTGFMFLSEIVLLESMEPTYEKGYHVIRPTLECRRLWFHPLVVTYDREIKMMVVRKSERV